MEAKPKSEILSIQIFGVTAVVRSLDAALDGVIDHLQKDFAAFASGGRANIIIELTSEFPIQSAPWKIYNGRLASVHGWGERRVCLYPNGVMASAQTFADRRLFRIAGKDPELMREIAYTILLSAMGEELDCRGFHRVHGLGVSIDGERLLLLGISGAGKSSLASLLQRKTSACFFSDESPLLSGSRLHAFPLRFALSPAVATALNLESQDVFQRRGFSPKQLFPFPHNRLAAPGPVDILMTGIRHPGSPRLRPRGRAFALMHLFLAMVVGLGLTQMAEWMLRVDALPRLIVIAIRRASSAVLAVIQAREIYEFRLGPNALENFKCLMEFFDARSLNIYQGGAKGRGRQRSARPLPREPERPAEL